MTHEQLTEVVRRMNLKQVASLCYHIGMRLRIVLVRGKIRTWLEPLERE